MNRVDPSDLGNYAIRTSAQQGHVDVVRELLNDARVNPAAECDQVIRALSSVSICN